MITGALELLNDEAKEDARKGTKLTKLEEARAETVTGTIIRPAFHEIFNAFRLSHHDRDQFQVTPLSSRENQLCLRIGTRQIFCTFSVYQ